MRVWLIHPPDRRAATLYPEIKKLGLCLRIAESSVAIPAVTHLSDAEVTQLRTQLLTSGTTESAMAQLDTVR